MRNLTFIIFIFCSTPLVADDQRDVMAEYLANFLHNLPTMPLNKPRPVLSVTGKIPELSALVFDPIHQCVWSLGDGDTGARIGKTDLNTQDTIVYTLSNATNNDWEAMVRDDDGKIWVLDSGDNSKNLSHVTFYRFDPTRVENNFMSADKEFKATYTSGPRDVEGAYLKEGMLHLFEKNMLGKTRVALTNLRSEKKEIIASDVSQFNSFGPITDVSISPTGTVFVMTYLGIYKMIRGSRGVKFQPVLHFYLGQTEAFIAWSDTNFLIGNEDGEIFQWKEGQYLDQLEIPTIEEFISKTTRLQVF